MIIVRKTIGKGIAPEILKKQFPYEIVSGGETKYFTEKALIELQSKLNEFIADVVVPKGTFYCFSEASSDIRCKEQCLGCSIMERTQK
jgi:hypothetical protein